ncbi:hypothetical protein ScPMuIL_015443 [Solemya velum]
MSRSSEDVLLIVGAVRHKKVDGTLYMMRERLAWMQSNKNNFSVSHRYCDIKCQKISPDSKEKVQLQLVMHDGSAKTFQFNNTTGRPAQQHDRDSVKEVLQQLLPKSHQKISGELEEKNRLLKDDPELFQLYKDLVVSQVITAEEFWASKGKKSTNCAKNDKQPIGVSAAFLADIKPQTDGCNGIKYNLTADIIESIFRTYPIVKMKHAEHVPHEMSESSFWTQFFQSHYFHRDRTNMSNKDVFSDCAKKDEEEMKVERAKPMGDLSIDLVQIKDFSLGEGYGLVNEDQKGSSNHTHLTMIRRFNNHSTMVLKACEANKRAATVTTDSVPTSNISTHPGRNRVMNEMGQSSHLEPQTKKQKIQNKLGFEDLDNTESQESVNLKLSKLERYLHGPTPLMATRYNTSEDVLTATQNVSSEVSEWNLDLSQVLGSSVAVGVLGELSPGGSLMQGTSEQQLQQMVSQHLQEEMKQLYNALLELLRHFWNCFPTSSKFLEEKVMRMKSALERFQMVKLLAFKERLQQYHYAINLTGHMDEMLSAAYSKFDNWQIKKLSKKS